MAKVISFFSEPNARDFATKLGATVTPDGDRFLVTIPTKGNKRTTRQYKKLNTKVAKPKTDYDLFW